MNAADLRQQFQEETGGEILISHKPELFHSVQYVEWLEEQALLNTSDLANQSNLDSVQVKGFLKLLHEKSDSNASFELGVQSAFGKELIDCATLQEIKAAAHEHVGDEWPTEWD